MEIPGEWREGYQELLLKQWLAIRCPQGARRRTDPKPRQGPMGVEHYARRTGNSRQTIYRWIHQGRVKATRDGRGAFRIQPDYQGLGT